jgi:hypothetical protein
LSSEGKMEFIFTLRQLVTVWIGVCKTNPGGQQTWKTIVRLSNMYDSDSDFFDIELQSVFKIDEPLLYVN